MRSVIIMGAGGRDFHNFNVVYRDDPERRGRGVHRDADPRHRGPCVSALARRTAIPAGSRSARTGARRADPPAPVDEVVFAYSDVSHRDVMHRASAVLAAGADFTLLGPRLDDAREHASP